MRAIVGTRAIANYLDSYVAFTFSVIIANNSSGYVRVASVKYIILSHVSVRPWYKVTTTQFMK